MTTITTIANEISIYAGEFESDYDLNAAASELLSINPDANSIDDFDFDEFIAVLERHDNAE